MLSVMACAWVSDAEMDSLFPGSDSAVAGDPDDSGCTQSAWYADGDRDGFGAAAVTQTACTAPDGYVSDASDCDDDNGGVNPAAAEACNGEDDDCSGLADDGLELQSWYADTDSDGFGDPNASQSNCAAPDGYLADASDCDDDNDEIPAAAEVCGDELDNDCNGDVEEGCPNLPDLVILGEGAGDLAGATIAAGADLDRDGFDDLVVGAPGASGESADGGAAYVFYGPIAGRAALSDADARIIGLNSGSFSSVAFIQDGNGDGAEELALATPNYGIAFAIHSSRTRLSGEFTVSSAAQATLSPRGYTYGGTMTVSTAGDYDGDGFGDLAVIYDDIFWIGPINTAETPEATSRISGWVNGPHALAGGGDLDGDGQDAVVVTGEGSSGGAAWVLQGGWSGSGGEIYAPVCTLRNDEGTGLMSATMGDVDGDGQTDVMLGAPEAGVNGVVYVAFGPLDPVVSLSGSFYRGTPFAGEDFEDEMGSSTAFAGGTLLFGAELADSGGVDYGAIYLLPYADTATDLTEAQRYYGPAAGSGFGSVAAQGDVNGDDVIDLLAGLPNDPAGNGAVYVYYGR